MESLLNETSVTGLLLNVPIPDIFSCPICLKEKLPSLSRGPTAESPFQGNWKPYPYGFLLLW